MKANITEENQSETYQYATGISIETMGNNSKVYNSNQCIASGWIESVKIVQNSETSGEKVKEFKEITYMILKIQDMYWKNLVVIQQ